MWAIYTRALAAAPSAVHANALNTSANFVVAALCGAILFGEALGGLWWVGAGLLIAGTAVIGRSRDSEGGSSMESEKKGAGRRGGGRKSARQKRDKKDE
jgi:drug/metabolite transporter (DMT)-like permease